jgi:NADPH:quinone reductase-like Zn-dependent oxidoreductase
VTHVAQNPTDWKHVHFGFAKPGSVVGCDFAGEVVEIGKEATGQYTVILPFSCQNFMRNFVSKFRNEKMFLFSRELHKR